MKKRVEPVTAAALLTFLMSLVLARRFLPWALDVGLALGLFMMAQQIGVLWGLLLVNPLTGKPMPRGNRVN